MSKFAERITGNSDSDVKQGIVTDDTTPKRKSSVKNSYGIYKSGLPEGELIPVKLGMASTAECEALLRKQLDTLGLKTGDSISIMSCRKSIKLAVKTVTTVSFE